MLTGISIEGTGCWALQGFIDEAGAVREFALNTLPFFVGRRPDVSLCIDLPAVSKVHAEIFRKDGALWVRDLQSTNGTFVNGKRIEVERLEEGDIVHFAQAEFRLRFKQMAVAGVTKAETASEWISLLTQFDRLFEPGAAIPHYQPVVRLSDATAIGYEVLARSHVDGLRTPLEMFGIAERLNMQAALSRMFRREGVVQSQVLPGPPCLFVNTHPGELDERDLLTSMEELRAEFPTQPLVLEIHEAAIASVSLMRNLRAGLTSLNVGLAYDDFGAGQSRLLELSDVPPDYLKFDMGLIRRIHQASPQRSRILQRLVEMTEELGIQTLAEGVECREEAQRCAELGIDFAQGYFFGHPLRAEDVATSLEQTNDDLRRTF